MQPSERLIPERCLPADHSRAMLIGRIWMPELGPTVVLIAGGSVLDLSSIAPTCSDLLELDGVAGMIRRQHATLPILGSLDQVLANSAASERHPGKPYFLAPCDLQAIKASGVTFVQSLLERVIEEHARGDAQQAQGIRQSLTAVIGDDLARIRPGSEEAQRVKDILIAQGAWSQYLEVGIGPDAEIFSKSQPLSAVGIGAEVGLHPISKWNNPEPELVLAVNSVGRAIGATLGNDVNLRDVEGRSALLLSKAKDNNGSCAIGPFIRLFDEHFTIEHVRRCELSMRVEGVDGFVLTGGSSLAKISRDPLDLVAQTIGPNHQYPDGFMLFLGTMFVPTTDRMGAGQGFTHVLGDIVTISTPELGSLVNQVNRSDRIAPWTFGTRALMRSLSRRGLL